MERGTCGRRPALRAAPLPATSIGTSTSAPTNCGAKARVRRATTGVCTTAAGASRQGSAPSAAQAQSCRHSRETAASRPTTPAPVCRRSVSRGIGGGSPARRASTQVAGAHDHPAIGERAAPPATGGGGGIGASTSPPQDDVADDDLQLMSGFPLFHNWSSRDPWRVDSTNCPRRHTTSASSPAIRGLSEPSAAARIQRWWRQRMPVPRGAEPVGSEGVKTGSLQMFTASRYRAAAAPSTLRFVQDASTVGGLARVPDLPSEALPLAAAWRQHGGAVTFDGRAGDGCNDPGLPFLKVETRGPCPEVAPRSGTCCSGTSSNGPSTAADTEDLMPGPVSHPELEGRAVACLPTEGCPTRAGCHEHGRPLHGDKVLQLRSRIRAMTEYCAPRGLEVGDSSPSHHASTATMPPSHLVHSVVPPLAKPAQHTASFQADIPSLPHATGIATADVTAAADATLCSVLGSS